jgi:hypothetical protein
MNGRIGSTRSQADVTCCKARVVLSWKGRAFENLISEIDYVVLRARIGQSPTEMVTSSKVDPIKGNKSLPVG